MENVPVEEVAKASESRDAQSAGTPKGDVTKRFSIRPSLPAHRKSRESPLSSDAIFKQIVALAHAVISSASVAYPSYVIYRVQSALLFGFVLILLAITIWMKLVSYAHTNYDFRALKKNGFRATSRWRTSLPLWLHQLFVTSSAIQGLSSSGKGGFYASQ